jgi:hypothetical protein
MLRLLRPLVLALAIATVASGLIGCGVAQEDGEVAAAIAATSKVETRAFTGSLKMQPIGKSKLIGGDGTNMKFSGAIDTTNDAQPKMLLRMDAGGSGTSVVVPGDGKLYLTAEGKSYSMELPAGQSKQATVDPAAIYTALLGAVGGFKNSPPLTNAKGQSVHTLSAKVSKKGLCGPVIAAFGSALSQAGGAGTQLGGLGAVSPTMMKDFCKKMLRSDPRVWFGIDGGKATDVVLTVDVELPIAGSMRVELTYHEYNQGASQTGFDVPPGATPISSPAQLSGV